MRGFWAGWMPWRTKSSLLSQGSLFRRFLMGPIRKESLRKGTFEERLAAFKKRQSGQGHSYF